VRSDEINLETNRSCANAYIGPFRQHYCKHRAYFLILAPMECRNM